MIYTCFHIHNRSRTKCSIYREKRQVYKNRAQRRGKEPICRNMNFAFLPKLQVDRIFIETTTYDVPTWRYEKVRVFRKFMIFIKKPAGQIWGWVKIAVITEENTMITEEITGRRCNFTGECGKNLVLVKIFRFFKNLENMRKTQ